MKTRENAFSGNYRRKNKMKNNFVKNGSRGTLARKLMYIHCLTHWSEGGRFKLITVWHSITSDATPISLSDTCSDNAIMAKLSINRITLIRIVIYFIIFFLFIFPGNPAILKGVEKPNGVQSRLNFTVVSNSDVRTGVEIGSVKVKVLSELGSMSKYMVPVYRNIHDPRSL